MKWQKASASKSVMTLPREIELDEDKDDREQSHESLEEEAFDTRGVASRSFESSYFGSGAARSRSGGGGAGGGGQHCHGQHPLSSADSDNY